MTAPTEKQKKFVKGLRSGKNKKQAALDAGYSDLTARNANNDIMPGIRRHFREELLRHAPVEKICKRIAEGLDAKETKLAQFEGKFTDREHLTNWSERRASAELAANIIGMVGSKSQDEADRSPILIVNCFRVD